MSDLIKYGAIGVGGYFLLRYFGIDLLAGFGTPAAAVVPVSTPQANDAAIQAATAANVKGQVYAASGVSGASTLQSVDFWNYYYQKVRGIAGPAPEDLFPGVDRNKTYTIDEWWVAMTGKGFSGMGMIAHHVNPYWNPAGGGVGFGRGLTVNGMEKYITQM
jgi:hypothetical protein